MLQGHAEAFNKLNVIYIAVDKADLLLRIEAGGDDGVVCDVLRIIWRAALWKGKGYTRSCPLLWEF